MVWTFLYIPAMSVFLVCFPYLLGEPALTNWQRFAPVVGLSAFGVGAFALYELALSVLSR